MKMKDESVLLASCLGLLWAVGCNCLLPEHAFLGKREIGSFGLANDNRRSAVSASSFSPLCRLQAKPPPTSSFDLDAIEAFETQLDQAALDMQSEKSSSSNDVSDDANRNTLNRDVRFYDISPELSNKRIDAALAKLEKSVSRSQWGELVADGMVELIDEKGDKPTVLDKKSFKVEAGMTLRVSIPVDEKPVEIEPEDLPLDILFEDEHMIIISKAAGMVVHPAAGNWRGTVVNALAHHLSNSPHGSGDFIGPDGKLKQSKHGETGDIDGGDGEAVTFRPGIVHRLDKGTTGVLCVAKTTQALAALSESFSMRRVKKTYLAVTVGNPGKRVKIDKPIGRHPVHRQRMRVVPDPHKKNSSGMAPKDRMVQAASLSQRGRRALSFVDTLAFDQKLSLVQVRIETGRTHQIRVHLQDRHTPIYGDDIYGLPDWNKHLYKTHLIDRPLLHAWRLEIDHPISGEHMVFMAPMAEDMMRIAKNIWPQGGSERPEIFEIDTTLTS